MNWTEENIEIFIKQNKDRFDKYDPSSYHENRFIHKLYKKFKKIVSIVPHLTRLIIITIITFIFSIWLWNSYIRKDRHEISLKQKIENVIYFIKANK